MGFKKMAQFWHSLYIHNGDRFVYIEAKNVAQFPNKLQVGEHVAQVFKPTDKDICKRCNAEGHRHQDDSCPAQAPEEISKTVRAFCDGKNLLSNLHKCPEGCVLHVGENKYATSEHYYQFHKLMAHDKREEAFSLLDEDNAFKVMQKAQQLLPPDQISDSWKDEMRDKMAMANSIKFHSCTYAMDVLLSCPLVVAEATGDRFWGTGLNESQTVECLSEYWPRENHMGKILMDLGKSLLGERNLKRKAESPLVNDPKHAQYGSDTINVDISDT